MEAKITLAEKSIPSFLLFWCWLSIFSEHNNNVIIHASRMEQNLQGNMYTGNPHPPDAKNDTMYFGYLKIELKCLQGSFVDRSKH